MNKSIKKVQTDLTKVRTDTICPQFYTFQSKHFTDVSVKFAGASKKGLQQVWVGESFKTYLFTGTEQTLKKKPNQG